MVFHYYYFSSPEQDLPLESRTYPLLQLHTGPPSVTVQLCAHPAVEQGSVIKVSARSTPLHLILAPQLFDSGIGRCSWKSNLGGLSCSRPFNVRQPRKVIFMIALTDTSISTAGVSSITRTGVATRCVCTDVLTPSIPTSTLVDI